MILPKKVGDSGTINTNDTAVNNLSAGFNIKVCIFIFCFLSFCTCMISMNKWINIYLVFILQMQMNTTVKPTTNTVGCKIETTTITFSHAFQCTAKEFYNVLTVMEVRMFSSVLFRHASTKLPLSDVNNFI